MEQRIFSDPSILAFFEASHKKFKTTPQRNSNTRKIDFLVEGEGIDKALTELYANSLVGVLDYIKALKSFRSLIFVLKKEQK